MRLVIAAWTPGEPKTKGSMEARPGGGMRESVVGSSRWKALMRDAMATAAARNPDFRPVPEDVAVRIDVTVYIRRPGGKTGAPPAPSAGRIGDLDKLVRNAGDAGTEAGIWVDDVQVTDLGHTKKRWAGERGPGLLIVVYELGEGDLT